MKHWLLWFGALSWLIVGGCGPDKATYKDHAEPLPHQAEEKPGHSFTVELSVPKFQVREAPDVNSRSLEDLTRGDRLTLAGPVSEEVTRLTYGKQTYFQPWLLVRTASGKEGWVHAAVVRGEMPGDLKLKAWLGKELANLAVAYGQSFNTMEKASAVIAAIRQAHRLAGALTLASQVQSSGMAPEVAEILPAMTALWMEQQNSWQFFVDYTAFEEAAQQSNSQVDDDLLQLYYRIYPVDSIGYLYPVWTLEAGEGKVYSLLGRGMHRDLLLQLDAMLAYQDTAGPEIDDLKAMLVNDMTSPSVLFWEAEDRVLAELEGILDTTFAVLTPSDSLALRRGYNFLKANGNNAPERRFNFRAGL